MKFTEHIVADMDESLIQRCLICGKVISDYTEMVQPKDCPPPMGYAAGPVYESDTRNPRITTIEQPDKFQKCHP